MKVSKSIIYQTPAQVENSENFVEMSARIRRSATCQASHSRVISWKLRVISWKLRVTSKQVFITHIKSPADLEASITLRIEKMASLEFSVQPYIVIIGSSIAAIHTRYIVINNVKHSSITDIRYESVSILYAIDICWTSCSIPKKIKSFNIRTTMVLGSRL